MTYSDRDTWRVIDDNGEECFITRVEVHDATDYLEQTMTKKTAAQQAEEFNSELRNLGHLIAEVLAIPRFAKWLNDKLERRGS